jgi:hypothetical protein
MNSTKRAFYPMRRGTPYFNEQVKLSATLLNNLAAASWIAALVAPLFTNQRPPWVIFVGGILLELCATTSP